MAVGGGVLVLHGPGLRQLAGGVDPAGEHVHHGAGAGLAAQVAVDHSLAAVQPGGLNGGAAGQDHHHIGVGLGNSLQHVHLVLMDLHVLPVQALGLADLVQAHIHQHDFGVLGQLYGGVLPGLVGAAVADKTGLKAHQLQAAAGLEDGEGAVQLSGVDHAGAGALVPGGLGKVADDCHRGALLQGQDMVLVLQQHDSVLSGLAGHGVVGLHVELLGGVGRDDSGKEHAQILVQPLVNHVLGQGAGLHRSHQLPVTVAAGGRHLQGVSAAGALSAVVAAAPVGDHEAVKAPLVHQNVPQQFLVLVGVLAVDPVVGRHDGHGVSLFYGDLKAGQVDLPVGPLVHHAVRVHPKGLLAVGGKVLGAGCHTLALDATDVGRRHLAGQIGILGEILKVAPAQGGALHVQAGAQQHADALSLGLFAQHLAQLLAQLRVPGVGHGGRRGVAGGGQRGVQPQMVRSTRLFPQPVRAVRQKHPGDVQPLHALGGEITLAAQQAAFLFQGHLLN